VQSSPTNDAGTVVTGDSTVVADSVQRFGPPAQNLMVTLDVDGLARRYRLYVPTTQPGSPLPLIVIAHGGGNSEVPFIDEEGFRLLSENEGVILAYPLGYVVGNNEGEWQLNTSDSNRHDINFVEAIIDDIGSRYPVDASRVYAVGYSLGGMFVYELACQLSHRFAAIASHAGTMPVAPADCNPAVHSAIMHFHGDSDSIIPYSSPWDWKAWDSVGTMQDIPSLVAYWRTKYACQDEAQSPSDVSVHSIYSGCEQGVRVEHHQLLNADHDWPTGVNGVRTSQVIWLFLRDFTRDVAATP